MSRPSSAGGGKSGGGGNKQSQGTTSSGLAPCGSGGGGGSSGSGSSAGNSTSSPLHSGSQQQQQQQQQQLQGQHQQQHHQQQQQGHELTALFECPVCFDYVLPPILQCQSGHLVCNSCRQKLSCCPTCRGPLSPSIRNLAMEKVASTVAFPCKYAPSGCALALHHSEKPEHEDQCEFRPYPCPCPGASCKWQGPLESVMPHLATSHKSITTLQGEDIVFLATDIDLPGAVDWVMMQSCFGHHFLLVLEKQERYEGHQQFFAAVLLVGSRKQAEGFAYRLELNGNRRRLSWEAVPRSIHEGVSSAILNSDCLVFDAAVAHLFADGGNLGINVTISMC
ncbi:E3 ubiquitin-protein ligase SIAH1A-like [Petromyzon marinus]|uniref:E3 ubiquitin-protein ligase n=1 Tax=Petromyzon marinus TaxID=7757 RepID=A0AAJ7UEC7_PETMA|nr:E3 ubiquitin-protein ligase SIAH1A-like [Petromyzon marinus]XP_032833670.1 E3 ubiquitin-protein ligase SIAH1A-like [Petromyzon marinus]